MSEEEVGGLISLIGVCVQLGGTALLLTLFYLVSRRAGTRPHVTRWVYAWLALLVALVAVGIRYTLGDLLLPPSARSPGLPAAVTHSIYLLGKLLFLLLLLDGVRQFARGTGLPGRWRWWLAGTVAVAVLSSASAPDLNRAMQVQQPVAVIIYGLGAWSFLTLPAARRWPGTRLTGMVLGAHALLWAVYGLAFYSRDPVTGITPPPFGFLNTYNSFFDTAGMLLLAFGQLVILLEEVEHDLEQARAERLRAVRESEARLKAVIETATDGILAVDAQGVVMLANGGAARLLGGRRREMVGRPLAEILAPEAAAAIDRRLVDVHRATPGRQAVFEVVQRGPDGRDVPLEIAASTFRNEGDLLDIFVLRDVGERRRGEAERAELQARLSQSLRMEALGRLVSGVAHELNNPLAAILTFSEQLLAERPAADASGPLGTIREQARRARMIVRDLLTFVRRREERRAPADMALIVERTVRALENDFTRQGVRLTVQLAPRLPTIVCDGTALEQVLTNLLDNAARATPGGAVTLTVAPEGQGIRMQVEDDGPGIPNEHFARLFEPFFTTRGIGEGTGLGLSVSLGIIEQHGGVLRAENRVPESGARFIVWLPLGMATAEVTRVPQSSRGAPLGAPGAVLLIDDEAPVRASLRRYFERQGWTVDEAADGREGIEKLDTQAPDHEYDIIICDLKMPGVTGLDVHQWIRARHGELLGRLVFASGDTATPETAEFLASNDCAVLEKPFELAELAATVSRVRAAAADPA